MLAMHKANAKRNGLLLGQFTFMRTRQDAYDAAIKESTLRQRVTWLLWPAEFILNVDDRHLALLQAEQVKIDEINKANARPRIEVVR